MYINSGAALFTRQALQYSTGVPTEPTSYDTPSRDPN
jgi:hypothetical protein